MKITYYGTGAGAGIPEIFCSCPICENARKTRGKEIRTRSQAVIDDVLAIEYPVDTFMHTLYGGLDMRKINHVLITHAHHDHFLPDDVLSRPQGTTEPVRFYASQKSGGPFKAHVDKTEDDFNSGRRVRTSNFKVEVEILEFYKPVRIMDYVVTPLPARHAENVQAMIFIISHGGKNVLWGHDTGLLNDEVIEYIKNTGVYFDLISLDCTLERGNPITKAHMDILQCKQTLDTLIKNGNCDQRTVTVLSHIGHLVLRTHEQLEQEAKQFNMTVAYDGFTINV